MLARLNAFIWRWLDDVIVAGAAGAAAIGVFSWLQTTPTLGMFAGGVAGYLVAVVYNRASQK